MADAVVIGAGHNGLVAANVLADAGWDVVVVEASSHPGGAVRSDRCVHPDFVTDLFSAFYPLGVASPALSMLDLGTHGLRWSHAPEPLAHVLPDGRVATLSRDLDVTAASLDAFAAGDGDAWRALVAQFERVREPLLDALFGPFPPVMPALRLARAFGLAEGARFGRLAVTSVRRLGDELFRGEGGRVLLAGNALHTDLSPEGAGSAIFGWLLCMLGQTVGFPVPVGGAGALSEALVRRLASRGGEVRCDAPVTRIEIGVDGARGVRLASGEPIAARRAVLADVAAPALYRDLVGLDRLPPRIRRDLDSFEWDPATIKVNWALRERIPWQAREAARAGTIHLGVDRDGMTRYAAQLATGAVPDEPFVIVGQMTTADATRSPAGTESAWAYSHLPTGGPPDASRRQADLLEAVIERHAPGFRDRVIARTVQAPTDLEAGDASLVGGAVNAGTAALHQQLLFRPVVGLGRCETPIDRLYLAGASAHPGGGVHGAPGTNAALAALSRDRLRGKARDRLMRALYRRLYA